ncbi:MAG: dTDP-4-dehydrorhamnose 3,5-epimerase family protein [Acetobacteraceae bacterium]
MIFEATPLPGLIVVRPRRHEDVRGGFARLWCEASFAAAGLPFRPTQISVSTNRVAGTLRGLHWQAPPHGETKLVRASCGAVFDVAVDLRPDSPTHRRWFGLTLTAAGQDALLIPAGFAHGFLTLTNDAEVIYAIDVPFTPTAARGLRYDDPALGIAWPRTPVVIADKDLAWPLLDAVDRQPPAA